MDGPAFLRARATLVAAFLLLCLVHLQLASSAQKVIPVQGKILYESQAGLCGWAGTECMGWTSATNVTCSDKVICDAKGYVTSL